MCNFVAKTMYHAKRKAMKRNIITALLVCLTATLATAQFTHEYEPSTGWPYLYEDFKDAIVYYHNSNPESAKINVHLLNNALHFTDGDKIMIVRDANRIDSVVCADKTVLLRKASLYVEVVAQTTRIIIGHTCEGDLHALDDNNGAYGTATSTGATQNVSSFKDHGNVAAWQYKDMIADRRNTRTLPTIKRTVFIIDNREMCHANKNGVNKILDKEQKKAFKTFLKENKIKWKNTDHLILVAQFLETIIAQESY